MNWTAFLTAYAFSYVLTMAIEYWIERSRHPAPWVFAFVAVTCLVPGITAGVVFR